MIINTIIYDNIIMYCHQFFVILCSLGDCVSAVFKGFWLQRTFLMDSTGMLFISISIVQIWLVQQIIQFVWAVHVLASRYTVHSIIIIKQSS